jgi:hypothetical protein
MQPGLVRESTSLVGEPGEKSRQESARRARRKERGSRPESDVLLLVKPSTGRHGSEAPSTKDGELGLVEAEPFLIGPETSKRKTEGFARTGGKSPGDVGRERHHNLGTPGR